MKLSNFELIEVTGSSALNFRFRARVDVTTWLIFKKTREISKVYGGYWFFVDTGKYTPGWEAENLARAFEVRAGKPIEQLER